MIRSIRALSALGVIILAGCGGGGGSSSTSSSSSSSGSSSAPVAVQMQSAMQKYAQTGSSTKFTVSGWFVLNGSQTNVSGSGTVTSTPQQSNGSYNETVAGSINGYSFNDTLALTVPYSSAPVTVTAGESGTIGNATYSVMASGANSLLVTITATSSSGTTSAQLQTIYKIDTSGNVTAVSTQFQETVNGTEIADLVLTF
jgi:hypothetical protein